MLSIRFSVKPDWSYYILNMVGKLPVLIWENHYFCKCLLSDRIFYLTLDESEILQKAMPFPFSAWTPLPWSWLDFFTNKVMVLQNHSVKGCQVSKYFLHPCFLLMLQTELFAWSLSGKISWASIQIYSISFNQSSSFLYQCMYWTLV